MTVDLAERARLRAAPREDAAANTVQSIQALRFIAAALVVIFHAYKALSLQSPDLAWSGLAYLAGFGAVGVHIFFVISGFVMVYTFFRKEPNYFSPTTFLTRRWIRIYPIYWITAATYLLFHYAVGEGYRLSISDVGASLLLLPKYSGLIIGPGWTLSYEVYFYLCFALLMPLGLRRGMLVITAFFLGSIAARFLFSLSSSPLELLTNPLLLEFLMGAWIAYALLDGRFPRQWSGRTMLILGIIGYAIGLVTDYRGVPSVIGWGIPSAFLVGGLVLREVNGGLHPSLQKMASLGDSSYFLYLSHILLLDILLLAPIAVLAKSPAAAIIASLTMTVICAFIAVIFYGTFERKMLAVLRGKLLGTRRWQAERV